MHDPKGIVVGIDGTEPSDAAAHWALEEAHRRGLPLTVLHAWTFGLMTPYAPFESADMVGIRAAVEASVDRFVQQLRQDAEAQEVPIKTFVIEGEPGPILVNEAVGAALLVVGTKGRGPLTRALRGSVSTYCVHHATCATVVVPAGTPVRTTKRRRTSAAMAAGHSAPRGP